MGIVFLVGDTYLDRVLGGKALCHNIGMVHFEISKYSVSSSSFSL